MNNFGLLDCTIRDGGKLGIKLNIQLFSHLKVMLMIGNSPSLRPRNFSELLQKQDSRMSNWDSWLQLVVLRTRKTIFEPSQRRSLQRLCL
jgi:hypothetical protein